MGGNSCHTSTHFYGYFLSLTQFPPRPREEPPLLERLLPLLPERLLPELLRDEPPLSKLREGLGLLLKERLLPLSLERPRLLSL